MLAVMSGAKAMTIFDSVGTSLLVRTLSNTTGSICSMVSSLTSYDQPGVMEVIDELNSIDLSFTISVIEQLVNETDVDTVSESIKRALWGVNKILENIHNELQDIQEAIERHRAKYFSNYRIFTCKSNIRSIKEHKKILLSRYQMLIDLLKIYN